jgi:hypothetical protein
MKKGDKTRFAGDGSTLSNNSDTVHGGGISNARRNEELLPFLGRGGGVVRREKRKVGGFSTVRQRQDGLQNHPTQR